MAAIQNQVDNQIRVYNLYVELVAAKKAKKVAMKEHTEEIKRIEAEIEELIENEERDTDEAQRDPA